MGNKESTSKIENIEKHMINPYKNNNDIYIKMYKINKNIGIAIYILNLKEAKIIGINFTVEFIYSNEKILYDGLKSALINIISEGRYKIDDHMENGRSLHITIDPTDRGYIEIKIPFPYIITEQFREIPIEEIPENIKLIHYMRLNEIVNFVKN